jgi:hypothetical protein
MLKRIVTLLVGGFVGISIAVAFIPSITGIVTSGLSGVTKVVVDISLWLIPLAVGYLIVKMGLTAFSTNKRFSRSRAAWGTFAKSTNIGANWHNSVGRRYWTWRDRKRR